MTAERKPVIPRDTDRNLLFGALALQLGLLDARQFTEACNAWAANRDVPLARVLCDRGWITPADRDDLERVLRSKLDRRGKNARPGPATLSDGAAAGGVPSSLDRIGIRTAPADPAADAGLPTSPTLVAPADARGAYPLARLIARGGLGRVWLARDPVLGRDVALKELRPEWADDPRDRERFLAEARIAGRLEHPNIVTVHDLVPQPDDRRPFYVMKHVQGRTLSAAIREFHRGREEGNVGPLELRGLLGAFIAVCNAVAYAHSRGVIHRDIKGENVILGDYGEVVVLDWGRARLVDHPEENRPMPPVAREGREDRPAARAGPMPGMSADMAPEQAEGKPGAVGPLSDVYGLGAVLYAILTGGPPFRGPRAEDVLRRVREEDPASPRRVWPSAPPALAAVCMRALARRPEDRYRSALDLANEVQRWLADEPVAAYREPPLRRLARWIRRRRTKAFLLL